MQQRAHHDHDADDVNVNAEPADSDHEMKVPKASKPRQPLQSSSSREAPLKQPPGPNRKRKAASPPTRPESELRVPGQKTRAPIVPKPGLFEQSRAAKELGRDKANVDALRAPPASSAPADGFNWGLSSQTSQKGRKKTFSKPKNRNLHVAPPDSRTQKGKRGAMAKSKHGQTSRDDDSDSTDVSLMSPVLADEQRPQLKHGVSTWRPQSASEPETEPTPADPELRSVPSRQTRKPRHINGNGNGNASAAAPLTDAELDTLLKPTLREQLGLPDTLDSSLPASSAPQEELDHVDSYVRLLPASPEEDEAASCPLCHSPLDPDTHRAFWNGRDKTVKNQALFCHTHRAAAARAAYAAEGYPPIDWALLPARIKAHRMALFRILTDETPSRFRALYAPLALTGKAAAVPSHRTLHLLPPSLRAQLDDDPAVHPGYYGARGRRLIAESVMSLLHAEIKRSADPVVLTSGPASFVQAVMVPEVAVRLIMEDLTCDAEHAEEVRERTYEMGVLLHEEVEDEVVVADDEEDEEDEEGGNEYLL